MIRDGSATWLRGVVAALSFPIAIVALVVVAILLPSTPAAGVAIAAAGLVAVAQGRFLSRR